MNYSTFVAVVEAAWTALAVVGMGLSLYLLRAELQDRALTIGQNGRTGILSWALVTNETLRVFGHVLLFIVGVLALATPNLTAPATPTAPVLSLLFVLFAGIGTAQSTVLIYARQRIARYVPPPLVEGARQDTLIEVQGDVGRVYDKASAADEKITRLTTRADASELRADESEHRADVAEGRADVAEDRADAAEEHEGLRGKK